MIFGGVSLSKGVLFLGLLAVTSALVAPDCIKKSGKVQEAEIPSDGDRVKWAQEGVAAHNKLRKKHGVPDLVYNPKMCKSTQWTANKKAAANDTKHTSSMDGIGREGMKCGENLAMYSGISVKLQPASKTVQVWYDEVKTYDFANHRAKSGVTGHFTQVVWKGSKEMCMSYAQAKDGAFYVAAQYFPPGNFIGKDKENVLSSGSAPGKNTCRIQIHKILILLCCFHFLQYFA